MSESATYKRIAAARAVGRFPIVLDWIADGRVHLGAVAVLAPHFTPENVVELLEEGAGKSKFNLEKMVAAIRPRPDKRDVVRALPLLESAALPSDVEQEAPRIEPPVSPSAPPPTSRQRIKPLSPGRISFNFTGSESLRTKLDRVRQLTGHTNPAGRLEALLERVVDFWLDRNDPDKAIPRRERWRAARRARAAAERSSSAIEQEPTAPGGSRPR